MSCSFNSWTASVLACLLLAIAWGVIRETDVRGEEDDRRAAATAIDQAEAAVLRKLEEPTDVDFRDTSLLDALNELGKRHELQMDFDRPALADARVSLDQVKVTLALRGMRLRSVFSLMLEQFELIWMIQNGRFRITTMGVAWNAEIAEVHDVSDLLDQAALPDGDVDALIDLLTSSISPESWDEGNNIGIERLPGALVVRQTQPMQEQIAGILAAIRTTRQSPGGCIRIDPLPSAVTAAESRPMELDFDQVPLSEVLRFIAMTCEAPVFLDKKGLEDAGVDEGLMISYQCANKPLAIALDEMLGAIDLGWTERNDVIYVSTSERIENTSTIAVFGLGDLFQHLETLDRDTLIDAITSAIEPESWDEVGGNGSIEWFPQLLVVAQQPRILRKIEKLLDDMRKVPACQRPMESTTPTFKVYGVQRVSAQALADLIPAWIEPTSWSSGGGEGTIAGLDALTAADHDDEELPSPPERSQKNDTSATDGGSDRQALAQFGPAPPNLNADADGWLFVRQTPTVQKQIEKLLRDMAVLAGWQGGGFRGDYPRGDHPPFP